MGESGPSAKVGGPDVPQCTVHNKIYLDGFGTNIDDVSVNIFLIHIYANNVLKQVSVV